MFRTSQEIHKIQQQRRSAMEQDITNDHQQPNLDTNVDLQEATSALLSTLVKLKKTQSSKIEERIKTELLAEKVLATSASDTNLEFRHSQSSHELVPHTLSCSELQGRARSSSCRDTCSQSLNHQSDCKSKSVNNLTSSTYNVTVTPGDLEDLEENEMELQMLEAALLDQLRAEKAQKLWSARVPTFEQQQARVSNPLPSIIITPCSDLPLSTSLQTPTNLNESIVLERRNHMTKKKTRPKQKGICTIL